MPWPTDRQIRQLDEDGFVVLEDFVSPGRLDLLRAAVEERFAAEGDAAGAEFKQEAGSRRLANLIDKGEAFWDVAAEPRLLALVRCVLGERFKLSSLNARSVNPHSTIVQPLHADMGAAADQRGYWVCNCVWMLDDFTEQNGPTRVIPGSHRWRQLPQEALDDPLDRHPDEVRITGRAGTVAVMNAHAWHGGLANRTAKPRRALHAFYCRRDKPQQQYQKQLVRPETQDKLSLPLRELLALDDPANDELSRDVKMRSGFLK